ncbi:uncharacterized protein BP5553_09546 [Venustampulla echinocandica]|uniref:G-protein coupled receptors family 2 profile 2 domain-containing protein n=1 Tax=Venustampulla echinocandica TaxID=2656787 RepID=A0A370TBC3_9HELO|nr:uncharacterized protein BP5553_09546 [Venustampulla echinocandica]RDL31337.1 hypothetical protein BP5553_09546 [Venustampulla echinocandica]
MGLTSEQIQTLIVIERFTASVSVIGTLILITTFIFIKDFRTLSNTLIFYASFANLFANVAALIGDSALYRLDGALCQFQSFLLEMFMQSDPMWSCAMAVNVYLVFFRRFDAPRLKKLYWYYGVICYGLPFIPAIFCLFYKTGQKGKMYGDATLWCWIDNDWAPIRIYSYYAPIWIAILIALIIYFLVGIEIFQKRSQLKDLDTTHSATGAPIELPAFSGTRTTDVEVTTDSWKENSLEMPPPTACSPLKANDRIPVSESSDRYYSITISAHGPSRTLRPLPTQRSPHIVLPRGPNSIDKIKWAYTKCAMLFAISILITWVPATVNRVYGLRYPASPSFALNIGSAIVLPLQGFWNAVIYFATSLSICNNVWARFRSRKQPDGFTVLHGTHDTEQRVGRGREKGKESSDSTVELSNNRSRGSLKDSY